MKTTKHKLILFLILTLSILFLTACSELSDADWELLEVALESWAEENGLLENDQWQPDGVVIKVVEKTIADFNNEKIYVELDGLDVVRDIEKADQLASEAMDKNDQEKMQAAIELRPKDWRLQEQNAVLWSTSANSRPDIVNDSYVHSTDLIEEQIERGGDCVTLIKQQLEYREQLLSDQIIICSNTLDCDDTQLVRKLIYTQDKLFNLYESGTTPYCDNLK